MERGATTGHAASGLIVGRVEVTQSIRSGTFYDTVVLGSQYRNPSGDLYWYIAFFPLHCPRARPRIQHVLSGAIPHGVTHDEQEAIVEAMLYWESEPASRPN